MYKYVVINNLTNILLRNSIMRVPFIAPLSHNFDAVSALQPYRDIRGGELNNIRIYQKRGGSLFVILGRLFKRTILFLRSILLLEVGNSIKRLHIIYLKRFLQEKVLK